MSVAAEIDNLFEQVTADLEIPPRPDILAQIGKESESDDPDLSRVAELITRDVALSAGMLKLANSPYFGLRVRARTAQQAVMMLGMQLSVSAVTGMVLRRSFPASRPMERFWDASAKTAQLSGWLTQQALVNTSIDQGDAYTFGLFRDCGIAVMMAHYGDDYLDTLQKANREALAAFTRVEREQHPTTHNIVGCLLARSWYLPDSTSMAIRHHHEIDALLSGDVELPQPSRELIAIAQLAERIVQLNSELNQGCEWEKLGSYCIDTLGLPEKADETLAGDAAALDADSP